MTVKEINERDEYVKDFLEPAFTAGSNSVKSLTYFYNGKDFVDEKGIYHYCEEIVITYHNDYKRCINVSGDSLLAMMEDVLLNGHVL